MYINLTIYKYVNDTTYRYDIIDWLINIRYDIHVLFFNKDIKTARYYSYKPYTSILL